MPLWSPVQSQKLKKSYLNGDKGKEKQRTCLYRGLFIEDFLKNLTSGKLQDPVQTLSLPPLTFNTFQIPSNKELPIQGENICFSY